MKANEPAETFQEGGGSVQLELEEQHFARAPLSDQPEEEDDPVQSYIPRVNLKERLKRTLGSETSWADLWTAIRRSGSRGQKWLSKNQKYVAVVAGPVGCLIVLLGADIDDAAESKQARMFGTLLWMAIWWLTEAVPIAITALLPLSLLPFFGILTADKTASAYFNDTQALFLGSFILALAVEKWNVHRRIALKMLLVAGRGGMDPRKLLLVFCLCPGLISMFISNTATAIMMVPMAVGVLHRVREGSSRNIAVNLENGQGADSNVDRKIGHDVELARLDSQSGGSIVTERGDAEITEHFPPRGMSPVRHRTLAHESNGLDESKENAHAHGFHTVDLTDETQMPRSPARSPSHRAHKSSSQRTRAGSPQTREGNSPQAAEEAGGIDVEAGTVEKREKGGVVYGRLVSEKSLSVAESRAKAGARSDPPERAADALNEGVSKEVLSYSKGVVLAIAFASSIGGMATLTGTGPNLVLAGIYPSLFPGAPPITYVQWLAFGFPMAAIFLGALWLLLCVWYCPPSAVETVRQCLDESVIEDEYQSLGPMTFAEKVVLVDFVIMATLWLTRNVGQGWGWAVFWPRDFIKDGSVSATMAIALFAIPARSGVAKEMVLDWETCKRLPWDIVLLMGGGFALSAGVTTSGLSEWIGEHMRFIRVLPDFLLTPAIAAVVTFTTEFSSNAATATVFLPLLAQVALSLERHPLLLMIPATIACSYAFMLPIATPPNAIAYSTGYFKMTDMARPGMVMNIIGIGLLAAFIPTLGSLVYGLETPVSELPWLQRALNATREDK